MIAFFVTTPPASCCTSGKRMEFSIDVIDGKQRLESIFMFMGTMRVGSVRVRICLVQNHPNR